MDSIVDKSLLEEKDNARRLVPNASSLLWRPSQNATPKEAPRNPPATGKLHQGSEIALLEIAVLVSSFELSNSFFGSPRKD
ncbi:hypothetical protein TUMEXPCC7403_22580 [Tumidithrix helvetica PCC 7403]